MRTNSVLSSQWISTLTTDTRQITTIERGVYTGKETIFRTSAYVKIVLISLLAFELKSRDFEPYQVSYTTLEKISGTVS